MIRFTITDIGFFEGRRVVDAVTGDCHDGAHPLETLDDHQLLLRRRTGKNDFGVISIKDERVIEKRTDFCTFNRSINT